VVGVRVAVKRMVAVDKAIIRVGAVVRTIVGLRVGVLV